MANNGTKVWLYETEADELVGFGSLGVTHWRWDNPKKGQWTPIYIIPFFGVRKTFWEQPPGPKSERYSRRIFEDLLYKAINDPNTDYWGSWFTSKAAGPSSSTAKSLVLPITERAKNTCE